MLAFVDDKDTAGCVITEEDVAQINATLKRTSHWSWAYKSMASSRKTAIHKKYFQNLLSTENYNELLNGKIATTMMKEFKNTLMVNRQITRKCLCSCATS